MHLILLSLLTLQLASAAARPNFLLIVADDLCWRDLGITGNSDVKSPHLDRLAAEGLRFDAMFTASATCSPLRHALYTGLHPIRSGAYPNHTMVKEGTRSLFHHLSESGYRTGLHHKSHVHPFESFPYELVSENEDDFDAVRDFLTRDAKQPWFLAFCSSSPHTPWTKGPRELYPPETLTVPPYLHDNDVTRRNLSAYYAEITALDEQVGRLRAMLKETGQSENTVIVFLSEQGSAFPFGGKWSLYDNGIRAAAFMLWPGHTRAGSRTAVLTDYVDVAPTFIEIAGGDPGSIDTGCPDADGRRGFDGRSLVHLIKDPEAEHRDFVFAQHTAVGVGGWKEAYPSRAARDAQFKLILNLAPDHRFWIDGIHGQEIFRSWQADAQDDPALAARVRWLSRRPAEELYDLADDPFETRNLADDPAHAATKERLLAALREWQRQQGDLGRETELAAKSRQPDAAAKAASERRRAEARAR